MEIKGWCLFMPCLHHCCIWGIGNPYPAECFPQKIGPFRLKVFSTCQSAAKTDLMSNCPLMQLLLYSADPLGKHLSPEKQLVNRRQVQLSDAVFADQTVNLYTRRSGLQTRCDVHGDLQLCIVLQNIKISHSCLAVLGDKLPLCFEQPADPRMTV